MKTKIYTIEELKQMFVETLLSKTDGVTKVVDTSVLNGVAFGTAKLAQKLLKEIALLESNIFPEDSYGAKLDQIAKLNGIPARFTQSKSSTYVRLFATPGTVYSSGGGWTVSGSNGVVFEPIESKTVGTEGFTYVRVRSLTYGLSTNVDALTLNKIQNPPAGHLAIINEYAATGGYDVEDDLTFKYRIKKSISSFSRTTLSYLQIVFSEINQNVLRVFNDGVGVNGKIVLSIITQNGVDLTTDELNTLSSSAAPFLSLNELNPDGLGNIGILLQNVSYQPIDISFRCELLGGYDPDDFRKRVQVAMNKIIDYRFWKKGQIVQWGDLFVALKTTQGLKQALDNYFSPAVDISIPVGKLPRIRGFLMLDLAGNVVSTSGSNLNPVFYPAVNDFIFQQTILGNI